MSATVDTDSEDDPDIVQNVLGIVVGLLFVGLGVFIWTDTGDLMGLAIAGGMGGLFVVIATYTLVKRLSELDTYNPVYIVVADMNGPGRIIKGFVFLGLFWVFFLYIMGASNPSEAVETVTRLRADQPELLVGWVGFNVLMVLGILFGSRSRHSHGHVGGP